MERRSDSNVARIVLVAALLVVGGLTLGVMLSMLGRWPFGSQRGQSSSSAIAAPQGPLPGLPDGKTQALIPDSIVPTTGRDGGVTTQSVAPAAQGRHAVPVAGSGSQGRIATRRTGDVPMILECDSAFRTNDSHATLVQRYGATNVVATTIDIGEGHFEPGTVLFPRDSTRLALVSWRDTLNRRTPNMVWVRGKTNEGSVWATAEGISIDTDLITIEKFNGRAFTLAGFGWDYGGTVMSWEQGRLQHYVAPACDVRMRLYPVDGLSPANQRLMQQVRGEQLFPSNHAAMQRLNPRVTELFLQFK